MQNVFSQVDSYASELFSAEDEVLKRVLKSLDDHGFPQASISASQGRMLQILARSCQATRILEVGTLGAYSSIWLARALPENGKLISLELNEDHAKLAEKNVSMAGLESIVEIRTGAALESLERMKNSETAFDFIFIDADKPPYTEYFKLALELSRKGTIIVADNVVRNGKLLDQNSSDPAVQGVQRFIKYLAGCNKVDSTLLQNVGVKEYDGMTISIVK